MTVYRYNIVASRVSQWTGINFHSSPSVIAKHARPHTKLLDIPQLQVRLSWEIEKECM